MVIHPPRSFYGHCNAGGQAKPLWSDPLRLCNLQPASKKRPDVRREMTAAHWELRQGIYLLSKVSCLSIYKQGSRLSSEGAHESSNKETSESAARKQSRNKGQAKHICNIQRRACTTWGEKENYYVGVVAWLTMSAFHFTGTDCSAYALR